MPLAFTYRAPPVVNKSARARRLFYYITSILYSMRVRGRKGDDDRLRFIIVNNVGISIERSFSVLVASCTL